MTATKVFFLISYVHLLWVLKNGKQISYNYTDQLYEFIYLERITKQGTIRFVMSAYITRV